MVEIFDLGILGVVVAMLINLFKNKPQKKKDDDTKLLIIILFFLIIAKLVF